jgi:multimeric flavodoxin WrbA
MPQNILIVNGSPRRRGNSASLAAQVAAGARSAGARTETLYLHGMDIRPCNACEACRKKAGRCAIGDDMQALYPKLKAADAVVMAGPVYWFTVSAQTKLFMDRWYAFGGDPEGYRALSRKRFGIVLAFADTDPFSSGAVNALRTFQDAIGYIGAEIAGMVYGSAWKAGEIRADKAVMAQAFELGKKLGAGRPSAPPKN